MHAPLAGIVGALDEAQLELMRACIERELEARLGGGASGTPAVDPAGADGLGAATLHSIVTALSGVPGMGGGAACPRGAARPGGEVSLLPAPKAATDAPCPAQSFQVPEGVKHLTSEQLDELTATFHAWFGAASTPVQRRSRGRLWVAFLMMRHGALRLGEVLALDDGTDLDPLRQLVIVRGHGGREIQLPEPVMREVRRVLDDPMLFGLRGRVFRLDQGYVRRKFYERAAECSIPKEYLNPRVIRHSRAVELLRGGVPLKIVQGILGHQSMNQTANYLRFSDDEVRRIVHHYLNKETRMKTSARNAFTGRVTSIVKDGLLVEVELTTNSGLKVVSVITEESAQTLGVSTGKVMTATVKAPWVILAREENRLKTSARNRYAGKVARVNLSEIAAEVVVDLPEGTTVCALLTVESVKALDLAPGTDILVMFKAFSVILNVE
ncbi:TOBE domain-containing protein [Nitratidesulfovibrio sp. HK-II]|jgi:molybdate transport system regulatory protein|uniref:TOBE domain-containing protein n=1 Tax=Nitratidesulfovibrio sp. HK-II TaxID=2009266 RepID=UPI000ECAACF9|nr:TOBE domain-containing protein [Nitratidesulfovibrio sp. HK-II]GBO97010.1 molybdenum-pterin binding domain protein [Nitratidesulfovibrio sp. HK-II]